MRTLDKAGRPPSSLAARLGGWSVRHRKTAIIGWLLFVIAASMIGAMAGQITMKPQQNGAGDSLRAERILADAGIQHPAGEMVIVHSQTPGGWRDAAGAVAAGVRATRLIDHLQPALAAKDGRDGLVRFEMTGDLETAPDRVQPVLDAVDRVKAAHPEVTIGQFGDASSGKWLNDILGKDFAQAEWTAVPLALGILLIAFGALLAALLPVDRLHRGQRAARRGQPCPAHLRHDQLGDDADGPGRRRRLLPVLHPTRARRARRGP
jgi:RND superfamily putative drug exporter